MCVENTRAAYPIEYIPNAKIPCVGPHPKNVILLACDAFGVLPPVSKLTLAQTMYHFISGYTALVCILSLKFLSDMHTNISAISVGISLCAWGSRLKKHVGFNRSIFNFMRLTKIYYIGVLSKKNCICNKKRYIIFIGNLTDKGCKI